MLSGPDILAAAVRLARDCEAFLLPAACLGCERPLGRATERRGLCDPCRLRLVPIPPPVCRRCGQPADRWVPVAEAEASCGFCHGWPPALAWATSAVWHDREPARTLVHALKYGGWRLAAHAMAEVMTRECRSRLGPLEVLVPVPLGRHRRRERGYNQADELAGAIAALTGLRVARDVLERRRETRSQTTLDPSGRRANVAGAFAARPASLAGLHVALVDDVLTTGATLAEAAVALAGAGPAAIGAVTFARAPVPH